MDPIWTETKLAMPDEGQAVIAWAADGKNQVKDLMQQTLFLGGEFRCGSPYSNQMRGVTHWMPMPEPPQIEY